MQMPRPRLLTRRRKGQHHRESPLNFLAKSSATQQCNNAPQPTQHAKQTDQQQKKTTTSSSPLTCNNAYNPGNHAYALLNLLNPSTLTRCTSASSTSSVLLGGFGGRNAHSAAASSTGWVYVPNSTNGKS